MSDVTEKWGEAVANRGFAQIPNYLLLANQFLDPRLTPIELLVLLQLAAAWWKKDDLPFPSVATLAKRCGVSSRQIQRAVTNLEKRELLKRVPRRAQGIIASNAYDLSPLVAVLQRVSKAFPNAFPRKGTDTSPKVKRKITFYGGGSEKKSEEQQLQTTNVPLTTGGVTLKPKRRVLVFGGTSPKPNSDPKQ